MNKYHIAFSDDIITIQFTRKAREVDILSAYDRLKQYSSSRLRLWDFDCGVELTASQIVNLALFLKSNFPFPLSKVALLCTDDLTFGFARMFSVYRNNNDCTVETFRVRENALEWLEP